LFVTVVRAPSRRLDAGVEASGPHDFAVRVSTIRQARRPRPPHPAPYVRDDRETPLREGGTAIDIDLIWVRREAKYFCGRGLDSPNQFERAGEFGLNALADLARLEDFIRLMVRDGAEFIIGPRFCANPVAPLRHEVEDLVPRA
jgi:hypothetical protein